MKQSITYHLWAAIIIMLPVFSIQSCYYEDVNSPAKYRLTVIHEGNGSTDPDGEMTATHGEPVDISAVPDADWGFVNWEILTGVGCEIADAHSADTTATLTDGNVVIRANFVDALVPAGSFVINNDNANTLTESVTLNITVSAASWMRFGNTPEELAAISWEPCAATKAWTLSSGAAVRSVYGEFRDDAGNVCEASDDIRVIRKIIPSGNDAGDFIRCVAISSDGSIVVIGSYSDCDNGTDSGSVYVYHGINWDTETKITPNDAAAGDNFGYSVAISSDGSTIVVGAYKDDDKGTDSGSVYVFDGTNWGAETKITGSDGATDDSFGESVAISSDGSTIVVGAYKDDDKGTDSGSIYIFDGTNWSIETKITANDGAADDKFGCSVAITSDGSIVVIGSYCDDDNGTDSGSLYIYDGTNWGAETKIIPNDGAADDQFGYSVAISSVGNTIVASAYLDNDDGSNSGSVYIYHDTSWGSETKITASDGAELDYFGISVAVSADGNTVVVGAFMDDEMEFDSGSVYIYNGINWGIETKISPIDGGIQNYFSSSVAVSDDGRTIVGAATYDFFAGSAYIIPIE